MPQLLNEEDEIKRKVASNGSSLTRSQIMIRSFQPGDETAFRQLNQDWISQHFRLEAKDQKTFDDPRTVILDDGGHILFAIADGQPVGCCALLSMGEHEFELSKLAVAPAHQGKGIGRQLMEAAIKTAKAAQARRLYLETNHILKPAIALYESLGFRHLDPGEVTPSPYDRADVYMDLRLS
jgi:putative acetyltransferase